jgi:ribosomal protein S27AE
MKSFDQILKEGKGKVKAPEKKHKKWRESINILMEILHTINDMYGTTNEHQVEIKSSNCSGCGAASFIIEIRDIDDRGRKIKYHRGQWLAKSDKTYYCEKCKKGK